MPAWTPSGGGGGLVVGECRAAGKAGMRVVRRVQSQLRLCIGVLGREQQFAGAKLELVPSQPSRSVEALPRYTQSHEMIQPETLQGFRIAPNHL